MHVHKNVTSFLLSSVLMLASCGKPSTSSSDHSETLSISPCKKFHSEFPDLEHPIQFYDRGSGVYFSFSPPREVTIAAEDIGLQFPRSSGSYSKAGKSLKLTLDFHASDPYGCIGLCGEAHADGNRPNDTSMTFEQCAEGCKTELIRRHGKDQIVFPVILYLERNSSGKIRVSSQTLDDPKPIPGYERFKLFFFRESSIIDCRRK